MLARLPWVTPAAVAVPKVVRINKDRRAHIVRGVAAILATGEPTLFAYEASCRHAVRSRLCLAGWRWSDADEMAAGIVADALKRIGGQRPTWQQGQPEFTNEGFAPILRTRCVRCKTPLPEGHTKFCSTLCGQAHFSNQASIQSTAEGNSYDLVVRSMTFWGRVDAA